MISGAVANVLDYGADPTGIANSTDAFNLAIATHKRVFVPNGTYSVAGITVIDNMVIEGESRHHTVLQVRTNGSSAFANTFTSSVGNGYDALFSNFYVEAAPGITNAYGWYQSDHSIYSARFVFTNIETSQNLRVAYSGWYIFGVWQRCIDGFGGGAVVGQTHTFIYSVPVDGGQQSQTNICRVRDSIVVNSTGVAAVVLQLGNTWSFENTDFEAIYCPVISTKGIFNVSFYNCWFEAIAAPSVFVFALNDAPNYQQTGIFINACNFSLAQTTTALITVYGPFTGSVINNTLTNSRTGFVLANGSGIQDIGTSFSIVAGNQLLACGSNFINGYNSNVFGFNVVDGTLTNVTLVDGTLTNVTGTLTNATLDGGTLTNVTLADVVNDPATQNINVLPLGPTGIGYANFTNNGFTSITNHASNIGLTANAVRFTMSGFGSAAYYTFNSAIVALLRGKTITLVASGEASAGGGDYFKAAIWDSITTPSYVNPTAAALVWISIPGGTNIQNTYVSITVGASATSLKVGFICGGSANGQTVDIESMKVVLGSITPDFTGF